MIYCKTLDKSFINKDDLFREIKANEDKIISLKRAEKYLSAEKGQLSISGGYLKIDTALKSGLPVKSGYVYPVINTTRYMDNHADVHFDGIWKKSLSEQGGEIFYLSGHSMKIDDVIAWPEDVKAFTTLLNWSSVGKNYEGQTEALVFEIQESKMKKDSAIHAIKERRKVQGSVAMFYVKIIMGVNSDDKDYAINKAYFDSKINLIANKERALDEGYFFGIEEAKINREGSMVLFGSNDATEIIYNDEPPIKGTLNIMKPDGTTSKEINYEYLIKNLK